MDGTRRDVEGLWTVKRGIEYKFGVHHSPTLGRDEYREDSNDGYRYPMDHSYAVSTCHHNSHHANRMEDFRPVYCHGRQNTRIYLSTDEQYGNVIVF